MNSWRIALLASFLALVFTGLTSADEGKFSPPAQEPGDAKILVVDDDLERLYSGPYLESTHILTALNEGGYSYDVFRTGTWNGTNYELPAGDAGLSIVDNYEVVMWYSGWNTNIMTSSETSLISDYLDGDCGTLDSFCASNRNIIMLTQMVDWLDSYNGQFLNNYLHADTYYSSYQVMDGTSNPIQGVSDSIFEGKEYYTDTARIYYPDRPCGIKPYDDSANGAFWMDALKGASHGHEYHAVQFPVDSYTGSQTHKAFLFATEIGVFNNAWDRADFFATILSWMEVSKTSAQNIDLGISSLEIPRHTHLGAVEKMTAIRIDAKITNYGLNPVDYLSVQLKLKNEQGVVLYDTILDTRAFPEGHPMHVSDSIYSGESILFTFNKTNDYYQRIYDGLDESKARHVISTLAGMNTLEVKLAQSDQNNVNNLLRTRLGVAVFIDSASLHDPGPLAIATFGDTDDNGASSYDGVNWHRLDYESGGYDWDADGCGWAPDTNGCHENGDTFNKTGYPSTIYYGDSSFASFNTNGWYKTSSDSTCDWGNESLSDSGCPKFTPNPNQDDYIRFAMMDLSGMEEVVIHFMISGCTESGDYLRLQVSKDEGASWTNLISHSGLCPAEGSWTYLTGDDPKYQGYVLSSNYYGTDDTDKILFRIQFDADNDQNTEGSRPYSGVIIDEFVIRGTEKITRDVAVGSVTVDDEFAVKNQNGNSLWREINATVLNLGSAPWSDLPVKFSVVNFEGHDLTDYLDQSDFSITNLANYSSYGDIRPGEGTEDQRDLFALFQTPSAGVYYLTVEVLVPAGKDYFPWNNTMTFEFRIFEPFFGDDVDNPSDRSDVYAYTIVERTSSEENSWRVRDIDNMAYSGQYVWQYAKEVNYDKNNPTTEAGSDDGLITQDEYDRDWDGDRFQTDVNLDLRAAYKPFLTFAIKWDLAEGDRLEVRAATDFDSDQKITSGTWIVLRTYQGSCDCIWSSSDETEWIIEEISLEEFEGYQTWIEFRVTTQTGGGKGVMIDDLYVFGNEYRNELAIREVSTERFSAAGVDHDLSVVVKSGGLEGQNSVTVRARILDLEGNKKWPESSSHVFYTIPVELSKGEWYTVSPDLPDGAGDDWRWGSDLTPGIYYLEVQVWRDDEAQVPDQKPDNNIRIISLCLGSLSELSWSTGDGWYDDEQSYWWNANDDGSLTSETFTTTDSKPVFIIESIYDLENADVKAQIRVSSSSAWYDIKWRDVDQLSTLYSIHGFNYTELPDTWEGNSDLYLFFADIGAVEQIATGGKVEEQYLGDPWQIRLVGSTDQDSNGYFRVDNAFILVSTPHSMDVKEVSPNTQNAVPSSSGDMQSRTYTVKSQNNGASLDSPVIDVLITFPENSFITLDDGTFAVLKSISQQGRDTVVAILPITGSWGDDRDDANGGDQTAFIMDYGQVNWPSGSQDQMSSTGWKIFNPTKSSWDNAAGKPTEPSNFWIEPSEISAISIDLVVGYAEWAPPGTYSIQFDVRSWSDYHNTFTTEDLDGQATMVIAKPDILIGNFWYTSHATGSGKTGQGWVKNSCGGVEDPYFKFIVEIINTGTETVGTFKVGLDDFEGNPLGFHVGIFWTGSGWAIDESKTTAEGAEIIADGNKKYVKFKATAANLGMSAGPGDYHYGEYSFYLAVDTYLDISESDENNNIVPITITAVKSVTTIGGDPGIIGYDIALARSSETIDGTPTSSMVAMEDGNGIWTVQHVKVNPHVSVNTVLWYLLDVEGNTKSQGLVSDIYGCHSGFGNAVVFVDNDFNGKLSPGDKFVIAPGAPGSDLESISDVTDYSFRLEYVGATGDNNPDSNSENTPIGEPPSAFAGDDIEVETGEIVPFTGMGADTDGTIILYEWDFDGDGEYDWSSVTKGLTTFTYDKKGKYKAALRVTDIDGNVAIDTRMVTVVQGAAVEEENEPIDTSSDELPGVSLLTTLVLVSLIAFSRRKN